MELLKRKAIYIETRNFFDYSAYKDCFERCGFSYVRHLNFKIDTSSLEEAVARIGKGIRRDVKQSERKGAKVIYDPDESQVREFYGVLRELYKTKVKVPLFPESFFINLFRRPEAKFLLVEYEGKIEGGLVGVGMDGRMYEWFCCGNENIRNNIQASKVANFAAITYCAQNGYYIYDMMGAGKPDEPYGVREFKARFGGTLVEEGRFLCIARPLLYKIGCLGVKLLKKL